MTHTLNALNYIDGHWLAAKGSGISESLNPANGAVLGTLVESTREDAVAAVAAARSAFESTAWSHSAKDRQKVLLQWADRLERRSDLAALLTDENGKVQAQARGEMGFAISEIRYYAGGGRHAEKERRQVQQRR